MKILLKTRADLRSAGRWDIDFHLPPEGIKEFPYGLLKRVDAVAGFPKDKRDPTKKPEEAFQYIDISSVDVVSGQVATPQDLEGAEAPSRARKVVCAFDLLISTCRPTRGAIAVVPRHLHNQVASTGFSLLRAKAGVNPFYLHYALRLPSTLEQFRKWSTGSSYPAILDDDVAKTLIPVPCREEQDHSRPARSRSDDATGPGDPSSGCRLALVTRCHHIAAERAGGQQRRCRGRSTLGPAMHRRGHTGHPAGVAGAGR